MREKFAFKYAIKLFLTLTLPILFKNPKWKQKKQQLAFPVTLHHKASWLVKTFVLNDNPIQSKATSPRPSLAKFFPRLVGTVIGSIYNRGVFWLAKVGIRYDVVTEGRRWRNRKTFQSRFTKTFYHLRLTRTVTRTVIPRDVCVICRPCYF